MIESENFYILNERRSFASLYSCNDRSDYYSYKCPVCGGIYTGLAPETVMKIRLEGKREGDYYYDWGVTASSVVSPQFIEVLKSVDATGFYDMPVEFTKWIDRTTGKMLDRDGSMLRRLIITGSGGLLTALNGDKLDQCEKCGRTSIFGIYSYKGFSTDFWDGSDMFCLKNREGVIIVTEKVKKAITKSKLKNVRFVRFSEFTFFT